MKNFNTLLIMALCIMLSSCAFFKASSKVAVETAYLESVARTGQTQQILKGAELSEFEMMQLTHAFNTLANFRGKWKAFLNDPANNIDTVDPNELQFDFMNIKSQYMIAYNVAMANWNEYGQIGKDHLTDVHKHASRLDKNVDRMMTHAQYISAIKTALEYVSMAGTLALALKP